MHSDLWITVNSEVQSLLLFSWSSWFDLRRPHTAWIRSSKGAHEAFTKIHIGEITEWKQKKKLHSRLPTKGREHLLSLYVDASFKRAWTKFALEGWADAMKCVQLPSSQARARARRGDPYSWSLSLNNTREQHNPRTNRGLQNVRCCDRHEDTNASPW